MGGRCRHPQAEAYAGGKIYQITCTLTQDIYVGSTIRSLCKRLDAHKATYRHYWVQKQHAQNSRLYRLMRDCGPEAFEISLLENVPCSSREELRSAELKWIYRVGTLNSECHLTKPELARRALEKRRESEPTYEPLRGADLARANYEARLVYVSCLA